MSSKEKQRTIRLLKGFKCDTCKHQVILKNGEEKYCNASITEPFPLKQVFCVAYYPRE